MIFFSCSKTETKPVEDVIIGKWVFEQYSGENEAVTRLVNQVMEYSHHVPVSDDFKRITEFTLDRVVRLYDSEAATEPDETEPDGDETENEGDETEGGTKEGEEGEDPAEPTDPADPEEPTEPTEPDPYAKGTYVIEGDTLLITYDGTDGFPVSRAKVWAGDDNVLFISALIGNYLDVEKIINGLNPSEADKTRLRTGSIQFTFRRK
jgi:hypothetical protein